MEFADLAILNGRIVTPSDVTHMNITVKRGRIQALLDPDAPIHAAQTIDAKNRLVLPGAIDIHFHCRGRSFPERGDFGTETRAAGSEGVTSVFEMPVSKPAASTFKTWNQRRIQLEQDAYVNVGLYAGPGRLEAEEIHAMATAGAIGFKLFMSSAPVGREDEFDGLTATTPSKIYQVLAMIAPTGLRCVFHAEEDSLLELFMDRARRSELRDYRRHLESRPPLVEGTAIAILSAMALELNAAVHIAHLTSRLGVDLIRAARAAGCRRLTVETCPHYLLFTGDIVERVGTFGKVNPPIRTEQDRVSLWQALDDGSIDVLATDHSPFTVAEKEAGGEDILAAPPGHPGVEFLLPFAMTQALAGKFSLNRAVELISTTPARLFNLYPAKGVLLPGSDADIVIYDPEGVNIIRRGEWITKVSEANRLYDEMPVRGRVNATILNGKIIYCDGHFLGQPGDGRLVRPNPNRHTGGTVSSKVT
jgi:dihydroorotase (multifunctional complex type)